MTTQDSEKIEQEESSENDAFRSSFSGNAYSLSGGGPEETASLATSRGSPLERNSVEEPRRSSSLTSTRACSTGETLTRAI